MYKTAEEISQRVKLSAITEAYNSSLEEIKRLKKDLSKAGTLTPTQVQIFKAVVVKLLEEHAGPPDVVTGDQFSNDKVVKDKLDSVREKIIDITVNMPDEDLDELNNTLLPPNLQGGSYEVDDGYVHSSQFEEIANELVLLFNRYGIVKTDD
jgi:hypothetical protein